jgi:hypothetical protein
MARRGWILTDVSEHEDHPADPSLLRRWLTALGLVATAEEVLRRGDEAASSTAMIAAVASSETLLGIIGTWSTKALEREPKHHQLVERARDALEARDLRLPAGLEQDLRSTNLLRNAVVHHGAAAPATQALLACRSARRLLDLLPAVSSAFGAVPVGTGIVAAIAGLLDAPDVAEQLLLGEQAVSSGDAVAAADAAARAHGGLLYRLEPQLATRTRHALSYVDKHALGKVGDVIDELSTNLSQTQGWVLASAMGMHPTSYSRLRQIIGDQTIFIGGSDLIRRSVDPAIEDARWALVQVAEMAFRLQELGSLIPGSPDDVIERRYGVRRKPRLVPG